MNVLNIHQAKTQLTKLVEQAAQGESFIIAKAGKPMVKVVALDAPQTKKPKRLDSLKGQFSIPDDFDRMFEKEIEQMFYGDE